MANLIPFLRFKEILKILKQKPYSSFKEIQNAVLEMLEQQHFLDHKPRAGFSKRTFERDIKDIESAFGALVNYSAKQRGYYLESSINDAALEQMLSSLETLNSMKLTNKVLPYVLPEVRKPNGIENMSRVIYAIHNSYKISFNYQKFDQHAAEKKEIRPIALKEFRLRWYLFGANENNEVERFGLDRVSKLDVTRNKFKPIPNQFVIEKLSNSFGIIGIEEDAPCLIELSFSKLQGKYIKALPLHRSQRVIVDNNTETRIMIEVYPSYDLIMEILSFGPEVKVVSPNWFVEVIQGKLKEALRHYE